ncbi:AMP-binding protein [Streptomyces stramineus]
MRQRPGTLAVLVEWAAEQYGGLPALRFRTPGTAGWTETGYTELRTAVRAVGRGLLGLGVRPGDRVAILAETRPEWTRAHFGALAAGAVVVPVYPTAGEEELAWVLADSGASVVVCEDEAQAARVAAVRGKLPELRHVVLMDGGAGALPLDALPGPAPEGELLARARSRRPEDVCVIVYTSGTTGLPKGCRLTHRNFTAVDGATAELIGGGPGHTTFLYLPLAHLLAQLIQLSALVEGGTVCFFGGRIENVVADLAEARPTHLPSVPRLFEKVHASVAALADSRGPEARARFDAAIRTGLAVAAARERGEEPGAALLAAWREADESLFSPVREAFGGRCGWRSPGPRRSPRRPWTSCAPAGSRSTRATA